MVIGGGNREVRRPQQIICHRDWCGTGALDFKKGGRDEDPQFSHLLPLPQWATGL